MNLRLPVMVLVAFGFFAMHPAQAQNFQSWLEDLRHDALHEGISQQTVDEALPDSLEPNDTIIRLDHKQPEGGVSFQKYKNNVVTPARIRVGRAKMAENGKVLKAVSQHYGVPAQYIVALWGLETSYGANTGGFETIPALVTLAYDARRAAFFRAELIKALRIVDKGEADLDDMQGSWAGAMGQCQFMPTSYEKYAQDFDHDGKADIWHSKPDVFASTAQYLTKNGWKASEPWGVRVVLPKNFDDSLISTKLSKTAAQWRTAGVPVPAHVYAEDEELSLVQSGGEGYKIYLVGDNYRVLLQWNTSTYFATAAGLLADALKG